MLRREGVESYLALAAANDEVDPHEQAPGLEAALQVYERDLPTEVTLAVRVHGVRTFEDLDRRLGRGWYKKYFTELESGPPVAAESATEPGWTAKLTSILVLRSIDIRCHVGRLWNRFRVHAVVGGIVLVLLICGLLAALAGSSTSRPQSRPAQWPPSVKAVQQDVFYLCAGGYDVPTGLGRIDFTCSQQNRAILWIFAALISRNNPGYHDKLGRKGLVPILPSIGAQVAKMIPVPHRYNPYNPMDSLQVAARGINNIVAGAYTKAHGTQPGLLSYHIDCRLYTGNSAFAKQPPGSVNPPTCAVPLTKFSLKARWQLVGDILRNWYGHDKPPAWMLQDAEYLFIHQHDPGDPGVRKILSSALP